MGKDVVFGFKYVVFEMFVGRLGRIVFRKFVV